MSSKLTGSGLKLPGTGELVQTKVVKSVDGVEPDATGDISISGSPTGSITMYAGTTAPDGWILCEGQDVSRTTYSDLFSVIGETYGSGNGVSTFTLPNLKGRSPLGSDSAGSVQYNTTGLSVYDISETSPYKYYRLKTTKSQSSTYPAQISYKMIKFFDAGNNDVSTNVDTNSLVITASSQGTGSRDVTLLNTEDILDLGGNFHNEYSNSVPSATNMWVEFAFTNSFQLEKLEIIFHLNAEWEIQARNSTSDSWVTLKQFVTPPFVNLDIGEQGGSSLHTLNEYELPRHNHEYSFYERDRQFWDLGGADYHPNRLNNDYTTDSTGANASHNNMHPYLVLGFIIKT